MTMPFAALKLAWGEAKFPLTDKKQKLRPFSGGNALATPDPAGKVRAEAPEDRLLLTEPGAYLVMVQGTLRADTSEDITLKAVVGGDPRFAGPGAVLPGESNLERLLNGLQGDALLTKFPGLEPARQLRPFAFWGVVPVPEGGNVPVELWSVTSAEMGRTVNLTLTACQLLAVKLA